ncbi:MAG TPA: 16S rRNA (cytosine(1402)-N(4))-methyltransferase RsmH [Candidatus Dormibacteraeota bacterium]|nr:16S rRNA (cytosine(1402)-N(4))-methyltransferase RsmH [Candidatus Dormibacteraeota bacterium]
MHVSVLLAESLHYLHLQPGGIYVDATFGAGGHSAAILAALSTGKLIAFDADPSAQAHATAIHDPRLHFINANFRALDAQLDALQIDRIDGILFDLGVSSMQLDERERGFSFSHSAPLDMRMNPYTGRSAYDVLAHAEEAELADIFYHYGEIRESRRLARAIVARRQAGKLPATTTDFAAFIAGLTHRTGRRERTHPATRAFQAIRIAVNDELGALHEGLASAIARLRAGGRIVAISFHSLEDRIVKQAFRGDERLHVLTKKPVVATEDETRENARSRSAKLRAAEKKAS